MDYSYENLDAKDKIARAKIQIQQKCSFFGRLSLYLKPKEVSEDEMENPMAIDINGTLYYKKKWVKSLTNDEVEGVILHEILHMVYLHLTRRGTRYQQPWNVAADIKVNAAIQQEGYSLPKQGLIPSGNQINIKGTGVTIKNIDKKTTEQIYDELPINKLRKGEGQGRFDDHKEDEKDGKGSQKEEEWIDRVTEAVQMSQMRGDMPKGLTDVVKQFHKAEIDWRTKLRKYIQSYIPYDYTFARCHKKSVATGIYMPNYLKEKIKVLIGVDLSGSISKQQLEQFMSEVIGMAEAFQDRIEMTILTHDVNVQDEYILNTVNKELIKKLKFHGGGGTSHKPIFQKIKKDYQDTKVAIFLTDGYSDLEEIKMSEYSFGKIIVLTENHNLKPLKGTIQIEFKKGVKD